MDTKQFILVAALVLVVLLLWDAWQREYGEHARPAAVSETAPGQALDKQAPASADVPSLPADAPAPREPVTKRETETGRRIEVNTDLFRLHIDTRGAGIDHAELLDYPVSPENRDQPVRLLANDSARTYIVQGGLLSNSIAPTHDDRFTAARDHYVLRNGQDVLEVPLTWEQGNSLVVRKIYEFRRGSYLINVRYEVTNNSGETWVGRAYGQLNRTGANGRRGMIYTYTGGVISSPEKRYEKISFDDMEEEKLDRTITNGWAAMIEHYFLSALVPASRDAAFRYYTLYLDHRSSGFAEDRYVIGMTTPRQDIATRQTGTFQHQLYIGPKVQKDLKQIAPGLELTVDYGMLWFLAKPLFWCLEKFHVLTGNWGWSIVLVTLMLKILFYKLSAAGYRSMANMRRVQPRLLTIRERYKNDRAKMNQAMMDIYKKEKINPLGGCFPILIQIPVFIALYWVLLESVELRQAPFILWLDDLSTPDPYFVLPLVMGATMFIQQKLNPAPMDPVQEQVTLPLPIVFTVFFAFFPSGLVLYWVVNNILSIAQQWLITRNLERAGTGK